MSTRARSLVVGTALVLTVVSPVAPALAETPAGAGVDVPAVLDAELSASEEQALSTLTTGTGVPLEAFVVTPDGPEIVTLDADSRTDAAAAAELLEDQPAVESAAVSVVVRALGGAHRQYGNEMVRSEAARAGVDGPLSGVVVAVLDTGVAPHPELAGVLVPGRNFTTSPGGELDTTDRQGHGTHVAGTVAADAASDVEGVAHGVRVMPVKVLGDDGSGSSSAVNSGIIWAAENGADVINMSLGGPGGAGLFASAVDYARSRGVTVVAAAGNDNTSTPSYPAAEPGVISVAAVDAQQARASFSNSGSTVDLAAPGVGILSTHLDGSLASLNGTSMASPHVAGVAALVEAAAPGLTPDQVERALVASTTDLGTAGRDDWFGHGLVDAVRAVQAGNSLESTGTVASAPGAPAIWKPFAGVGSVVVRWAAPTVTGGAPVTGYTVRAHRGSTLVKTVTAGGSATRVTVTGLTNGTGYRFTVTAVNVAGAGRPSALSATATPRTVPGAPAIWRPFAGDGSVVVRWAAPTVTGGAPVTGYTVRAYRGSTLVKTVTARGSATRVTVTGLRNGTGYWFKVAAVNEAGAGPRSKGSATVTPRR
ncbi:S8 family serine peptidase [Geodermatophilus pulveris]|uniref:S8 family serine peptidase n=1 Tax=Geodermatophilus pulveris TaxID=1564159 RepID=UPI000B772B46|nr:S8 family serine peptidase [Geodermatophilus pulveris]